MNDKIIDNLKNWEQISGYYLATGGEDYITIGGFNKVTTLTSSPRKKVRAKSHLEKTLATYYLFDLITITEVKDTSIKNKIDINQIKLVTSPDSLGVLEKEDTLLKNLIIKEKFVLNDLLFNTNDSVFVEKSFLKLNTCLHWIP